MSAPTELARERGERAHLGGHIFTLTEAAEAAGVSRSTIRRKTENGAFPSAYKGQRDGAEVWLVPLADLLAAGLRVNAPSAPGRAHERPLSAPSEHAHDQAVSDPEHVRVRALEQRVAVLEAELRGARAVADEREKRAANAERALLMLEARNPRPPEPQPEPSAPPPPAAPVTTPAIDGLIYPAGHPIPESTPTEPKPRQKRRWFRRG